MSTKMEANKVVYPPNAVHLVHKYDGYIGNLTASQQKALSEMRTRIGDLDTSVTMIPDEPQETLFLRYLRARSFSVTKAEAMLRKSVAFKTDTMSVKAIRSKTPQQILGCSEHVINRYWPQYVHGTDKQGRLIVIYKAGILDAKGLLKHTSVDQYIEYLIWRQERVRQLMALNRKRTGYFTETNLLIFDMKGLEVKRFNGEVRVLIKRFTTLMQDYYPESNGKTFIVNSSMFFKVIWSFTKPFVDKQTQRKVGIHSTKFKKELLKDVEYSQLPGDLGGQQPLLKLNAPTYVLRFMDHSPAAIAALAAKKQEADKAEARIRAADEYKEEKRRAVERRRQQAHDERARRKKRMDERRQREEAERRRRENELELERERIAAMEEERQQRAAESAERQRRAAAAAARQRIVMEQQADRRRAAAAAEAGRQQRKAEEAAKKRRVAAMEVERRRRAIAEEVERQRRDAEEAETLRRAAEEALRLQRAEEEVARQRRAAEEAEKQRLALAWEAERLRQAVEAAERSQKVADDADRQRIVEDTARQRLAAAEAERQIVAAEREAEWQRRAMEAAERQRQAAEKDAERQRRAAQAAEKQRRAAAAAAELQRRAAAESEERERENALAEADASKREELVAAIRSGDAAELPKAEATTVVLFGAGGALEQLVATADAHAAAQAREKEAGALCPFQRAANSRKLAYGIGASSSSMATAHQLSGGGTSNANASGAGAGNAAQASSSARSCVREGHVLLKPHADFVVHVRLCGESEIVCQFSTSALIGFQLTLNGEEVGSGLKVVPGGKGQVHGSKELVRSGVLGVRWDNAYPEGRRGLGHAIVQYHIAWTKVIGKGPRRNHALVLSDSETDESAESKVSSAIDQEGAQVSSCMVS